MCSDNDPSNALFNPAEFLAVKIAQIQIAPHWKLASLTWPPRARRRVSHRLIGASLASAPYRSWLLAYASNLPRTFSRPEIWIPNDLFWSRVHPTDSERPRATLTSSRRTTFISTKSSRVVISLRGDFELCFLYQDNTGNRHENDTLKMSMGHMWTLKAMLKWSKGASASEIQLALL